jgi:hypothetical protein
MQFDPCEHQLRNFIIKAGVIIRQLRGLPDEKNITILYEETAPLFGITPAPLYSSDVDHLPTPEESARENPQSPFLQICPKCGRNTYLLKGLCGGCKDSEGGKYKSIRSCMDCKHQEKYEKPMVVWLEELGIDFSTQTKKSLGIQTVTDDGVK